MRGADSGRDDGRPSVMSVINGLTAAAHTVEGMSPERSIDFQKTAGELLFKPDFLQKQAALVAKKVEAAAAAAA